MTNILEIKHLYVEVDGQMLLHNLDLVNFKACKMG